MSSPQLNTHTSESSSPPTSVSTQTQATESNYLRAEAVHDQHPSIELRRSPSPAKRTAREMEMDYSANGIEDGKTVDEMEVEAPSQVSTIVDDRHNRDQSVDMLASPSPSDDNKESGIDQAARINEVKEAVERAVEEGTIFYIISGTFYKRFLASDKDEMPQKDDTNSRELGVLGPIDNGNIVKSVICSSDTKDKFYALKDDMNFGTDYEALPEDAWKKLVEWYGIVPDTPIIKRQAVNTVEGDNTAPKNIQIELRPPIFTIYQLRAHTQVLSHEALKKNAQISEPKQMVVGKMELFQQFLVTLKRILDIAHKDKVQIWQIPLDSLDGNKMMVDIATFLNISDNIRTLVDLKDDTGSVLAGKYTGTSTIGSLGLAEGGKIVVEIREDGEWPSDRVGRALRRTELDTIPVGISKGGVTSASLSSLKGSKTEKSVSQTRTESPLTSGASTSGTIVTRRTAKPVGTCGLNNLGNTCYMNSALQCIRSVEELSKYFLDDEYKHELNPSNPLAHNGKVAIAYGNLLRNLFAPNSSSSSFAPREFKNIIGRFAPSFSGFGQQDTQEFLAFLLDGLHEDLNRIHDKPYIEKPESTDEMVGNPDAIASLARKCWDIYKARNDSAVADLFGGQYKSTLICPDCRKVSITFDPFMDLTLPLPLENMWAKDITFIPSRSGATSFKHAITVNIEMDKHSSVKSLKESVASKLGLAVKNLVCSEVYRNKFYKHLDDFASVGESIQQNDDIFLYEIDDTPTNHPPPKTTKRPATRSMLHINYNDSDDEQASDENAAASEKLLVPVFHKVDKEPKYRQATADFFGVPFFIVLNKKEQMDYDCIVQKIMEKYQTFTTMNLFDIGSVHGASQRSEDESEVELDYTGDEAEVIERDGIKTIDDDKEGSDGFVDVAMEDADVDDVTNSNDKHDNSRNGKIHKNLLRAWNDMIIPKVLPNKGSTKVPTAWTTTESQFPLLSARVRRVKSSPGNRKQNNAGKKGTYARTQIATPTSDLSEDELNNVYEDALTGHDNNSSILTHPSEEEEDEGIETDVTSISEHRSTNGITRTIGNAFSSVKSGAFYGKSKKGLKDSVDKPPLQTEMSLLKLGEGIVCYWREEAYDSVFCGRSDDDLRGKHVFEAQETFHDEELLRKRQLRESRRKKGIHLEDCLDEFAKEEILSEDDPWYCPRCKVHRRASKTFELWKCPDILVVHLKRFSSSRSFRDKIDALIEFPTEGLDLTQRVGEKIDGRELIYDLFAVDNHYGGLGGGHYTAYAKNWADNNWYLYDDSSVRQVQSKAVITQAAYLLFYRRRSNGPLGGPNFEKLDTQTNEKTPNGLNSPETSSSPSPTHSFMNSSPETIRGGIYGPLPPKYEESVGAKNSPISGLPAELSETAHNTSASASELGVDVKSSAHGQQKSAPLCAPPYSHSLLFGSSSANPETSESLSRNRPSSAITGNSHNISDDHITLATASRPTDRLSSAVLNMDEGIADDDEDEIPEAMPTSKVDPGDYDSHDSTDSLPVESMFAPPGKHELESSATDAQDLFHSY